MRLPQYKLGFQDGGRWAITFLHAQAAEMNDPNAKAVLNTAAFHMGNALRDIRVLAKHDELERQLAASPPALIASHQDREG